MRYVIADLLLDVVGERLSDAVNKIPGFRHFEVPASGLEPDVVFNMAEEGSAPAVVKELYKTQTPDNCTIYFYSTDGGYLLKLVSIDNYVEGVERRETLLWNTFGEREVYICGSLYQYELKFALWIGYGLVSVRHGVGAIHSSCIVAEGKGVLFLGESGTGKSTHTRLWRECIDGAELLNDDSPLVKIEGGVPYIYGSPWSGKTPCYRDEKYPLAACVRLSQAPYNKITRLPVIKAYGALHPSFPPEFAYSKELYGKISDILGVIISSVPCWHLECLPNHEAAQLSYRHCIGG